MNYEIDQSGKIEQTSKATVVAYGNSKTKSIYIAPKVKRQIQRIFKDAGKPDIFVYRTFAVLIFLLIKYDIKHIQNLLIDYEYVGKEGLIKKYLLELLRTDGLLFDSNNISFLHIGKNSSAHHKAITVFRKKESPDISVEIKDLLTRII